MWLSYMGFLKINLEDSLGPCFSRKKRVTYMFACKNNSVLQDFLKV